MSYSTRLTTRMNIFPKEVNLMNLQGNEFKEYIHQHSHYSKHTAFEDTSFFKNAETNEVHSLRTIPSVKTLISIEGLTFADKAIFEKSIFD